MEFRAGLISSKATEDAILWRLTAIASLFAIAFIIREGDRLEFQRRGAAA